MDYYFTQIVKSYEHSSEEEKSCKAKDFPSSLCVQTGSGAHLASCTMGTWGPFPVAKRGRGVTLTTHPHVVPRLRMSRSYTSSPPSATMACSGTALLCFAILIFVD
jgi:hypothetical protein